MVRVPGSSGDSGFHRESTDQEETKVKAEPEIEASTEGKSPSTPLNEAGFADRQSAGRNSDDLKKEEDSAMDLEEKPRLPPQTPSGVPADRDEYREPPDEGLSVKADGSSPTSNPSRSRSASKKSKKARTSKKKMKAPESDTEDRDGPETWTNAQLEQFEDTLKRKKLQAFLIEDSVMKIMRLKIVGTLQGPVTTPVVTTDKLDAIKMLMHLLKEAGIVQGAFEVNELLDRDVADITRSTMVLHLMLTPLVGSTKIEIDTAPAVSPRNPEYQTGSSQYASATSEAESETSVDLQRMTLGPSGAAMLQQRKMKEETIPQQPVLTASSFMAPDRGPADRMQSFFNAAMDRFLREQQTPEAVPAAQFTRPTQTSAGVPPAPGAAATAKAQGTQDVEMESVGSRHSELADEYDPDDLSLEAPRRAAVASAGATSGNASTPQRIRVSAISELKDFSGKDGDVDRARSWIGKAKSAFLRDQAPDSEKCLVFGDLMSGPARNWYRQLARSIRSDWKSLLESFLVQYCERGVSVARQYYHARKRSDESPIEYLHRLNVAGMRAKLPIKGGTPSTRREHVEHFIETLDDRDLADQLVLLRLRDADELEETLRLRQRSKARQGRAAGGSNKFRQRAAPAANSASAKPARAIHAVQAADGSSSSESDDSESDHDAGYRRIHVAAANERDMQEGQALNRQEPPSQDQRLDRDRSLQAKQCSHCGSTRHDNFSCWKRLTCQKCGKRGHPSDQCLHVCRACGELHDMGKCPMEEFYNMIRQWYNPGKHAGMLPENAEKMLN